VIILPNASTGTRVPPVPLGHFLLLLPSLWSRDLLLCWAIAANVFFLKFRLSLFHFVSAGLYLPGSLGGLFCVKHLVYMPQIIPVLLSDAENLLVGKFSFLFVERQSLSIQHPDFVIAICS